MSRFFTICIIYYTNIYCKVFWAVWKMFNKLYCLYINFPTYRTAIRKPKTFIYGRLYPSVALKKPTSTWLELPLMFSVSQSDISLSAPDFRSFQMRFPSLAVMTCLLWIHANVLLSSSDGVLQLPTATSPRLTYVLGQFTLQKLRSMFLPDPLSFQIKLS